MKKLFFLIAIFATLSFKTNEEPKTVTITFTVEETNLIFDALGELPAKKVEALRAKIYNEAMKQLNPEKDKGNGSDKPTDPKKKD